MIRDTGLAGRSGRRTVFGAVVCTMAFLSLAVSSLASAPPDWPPFLRGKEAYPAPIVSAVERLWVDATFMRTVRAEPAPVPLSSYLRFVDAPDVTAAAARHLGLTTYHVKVLGNDRYEADDGHGGAHGVYRVLAREGGRRVLLSWGSHRGSILGTVSGSALTRLEFADEGSRATQGLTVNVIIDNGVAASVARPVLLLFGWFVDRKLEEAFRTAASAAAWAHTKPEEFCPWLDGALTGDRRAELRDIFAECEAQPVSRATGRALPGSRPLRRVPVTPPVPPSLLAAQRRRVYK